MAPPGSKVLVALRPEKIALSAAPGDGAIAGTVSSASYLGERSHYMIALPGRAEPIAVASQNSAQAQTHAPGETVYLSWATDSVVVLTE